ncbi:holo-ACP synthase [candidate division WOR-3 bacterium]|nr:holo-ACP synthase [candidate division WOR-3 bacterium]
MKVGIDIAEIKRISEVVRHWGDKFLNRIFTKNELKEWKARGSRTSFLAGRFAAKEAFLKAIGTSGIRWKEIEVLGGLMEKPVIWFGGKKIEGADLSISHTEELAISIVIIPNNA